MDNKPTKLIDTKKIFGVTCNFEVFAFERRNEHVPDVDLTYHFDPETTVSILAGFANNRRSPPPTPTSARAAAQGSATSPPAARRSRSDRQIYEPKPPPYRHRVSAAFQHFENNRKGTGRQLRGLDRRSRVYDRPPA